MKLKLIPAAMVAGLLIACGTPAGMSPYRLVDAPGPVVMPGAFAGPTFSLLGPVESVRVPFALGRLDHIEVWFRRGNQAFTKAGELAYSGTGDLDHTFPSVKFVNLVPRKSYDVQLRAFQVLPGDTGATEVTAGSIAQGASTADYTHSTTRFSTNATVAGVTDGANDTVDVATGFKLKLADQTFSGVASGSITATGGALTTSGDPVALVTPTPE